MFGKIAALWAWFIDGLTDAVITCVSIFSKQNTVELVIANKQAILRETSGKKICLIPQFNGPIITDITDLPKKLRQAQIDVIVPQSLVLHRALSSLSAESMPFLDAFVRHQIERVTPWKASDTYFGVSTNRMPGNPPKVAVSIHVVARSLVEQAINAARAFRPSRLILSLPTQSENRVAVSIDDSGNARRSKIRKIVQVAVAGLIILMVGRLALYPTEIAALQSQTADIESEIEDQQTALASLHGGAGHFGAADLIALRQLRPRIVETLENLSRALPDDDYLTSLQLSNDELHISGISTKTSDLVPALEGSGHFRDVSFAEPITRMQSGDGNKFHLSMRVVPPTKVTR